MYNFVYDSNESIMNPFFKKSEDCIRIIVYAIHKFQYWRNWTYRLSTKPYNISNEFLNQPMPSSKKKYFFKVFS